MQFFFTLMIFLEFQLVLNSECRAQLTYINICLTSILYVCPYENLSGGGGGAEAPPCTPMTIIMLGVRDTC